MHLGVDFGTTRSVVAVADRGNYPVLGFADLEGDMHEHVPSLVADRDGELVFGFDAVAAARTGAPLLRSLKRHLSRPDLTMESTVEFAGRPRPLLDLVAGYLRHLRGHVQAALGDEALDGIVAAVPAHAHGAQRLLTLEAFARAGFEVTALVNEPSAAGYEFTHRQARAVSSRRTKVLVYDLGGGTFDASLVEVRGTDHAVLGSLGENRLGGDDFDLALVEQALAAAGMTADQLRWDQQDDLLEQCRDAKERLTPQSRRIALEVADQTVVLPVVDFYAAVEPLVRRTIEILEPLAAGLQGEDADVAGIHVVGGASGLPLVSRMLREAHGRRVHRSPQPGASTAVGLAIAADPHSGFTLSGRLSRGFGVFRELARGRQLGFDELLSRHEVTSGAGRVIASRRYRAQHNVGCFRFVEYSQLDQLGQPTGDLVPVGQLLFPFERELQDGTDLSAVPVERRQDGPMVEESYSVDAFGIIQVTLTDLDTGHRVSSRMDGSGA